MNKVYIITISIILIGFGVFTYVIMELNKERKQILKDIEIFNLMINNINKRGNK